MPQCSADKTGEGRLVSVKSRESGVRSREFEGVSEGKGTVHTTCIYDMFLCFCCNEEGRRNSEHL